MVAAPAVYRTYRSQFLSLRLEIEHVGAPRGWAEAFFWIFYFFYFLIFFFGKTGFFMPFIRAKVVVLDL